MTMTMMITMTMKLNMPCCDIPVVRGSGTPTAHACQASAVSFFTGAPREGPNSIKVRWRYQSLASCSTRAAAVRVL